MRRCLPKRFRKALNLLRCLASLGTSARFNIRPTKLEEMARVTVHGHRIDPEAKHFVEFNGRPVTSVKTAFRSAVRLAGLGPRISPHTLQHTAATWLMQRGADPWQAAGYLGMSLEVLLNTYGHHHPDYLSDAVEKIAMRERGERKRTYLVR